MIVILNATQKWNKILFYDFIDKKSSVKKYIKNSFMSSELLKYHKKVSDIKSIIKIKWNLIQNNPLLNKILQ